MTDAPTRLAYTGLDAAYDHFNRRLFGGELPPCLITMQRHKGSYGYFSGDRFANRAAPKREITDEIALNPEHFARPPVEILSTLVHEACHLWQHRFGKPSRGRYHNREWAGKMREVGLCPSDTGEPGGKETGDSMSHYVEKGGRFEEAARAFLKSHPAVFYYDRAVEDETRRRSRASKTRYSCPRCGQNAWAKPKANLLCGDCENPVRMETEEPTDDED